jgi:hypothetical protein
MHYVTCSYHQMEKHKFSETCPDALFVKNVQVPPEHEIWCIDVSCLGHSEWQYVSSRSHRMQKHK